MSCSVSVCSRYHVALVRLSLCLCPWALRSVHRCCRKEGVVEDLQPDFPQRIGHPDRPQSFSPLSPVLDDGETPPPKWSIPCPNLVPWTHTGHAPIHPEVQEQLPGDPLPNLFFLSSYGWLQGTTCLRTWLPGAKECGSQLGTRVSPLPSLGDRDRSKGTGLLWTSGNARMSRLMG